MVTRWNEGEPGKRVCRTVRKGRLEVRIRELYYRWPYRWCECKIYVQTSKWRAFSAGCDKLRAGDLLMFEDETVDITCPKCGKKNSVLVRDFEASAEARISCHHCGVMVKVEAEEFRRRLALVRKELEEIQLEARRATKSRRPRKDDFQI